MILSPAALYFQEFNMAHRSWVKLPVSYALCYLLDHRDAIADSTIPLQVSSINFLQLDMNNHAMG